MIDNEDSRFDMPLADMTNEQPLPAETYLTVDHAMRHVNENQPVSEDSRDEEAVVTDVPDTDINTDSAEGSMDYCKEFEIPESSVSEGYIVNYLGMIHSRCRSVLYEAMMARVFDRLGLRRDRPAIINPDYPLWQARIYGSLCYGNHCADEKCDFCGRYSWQNNHRPHALTHEYAEIEGGFGVVCCDTCFTRLQRAPRMDRFLITWHNSGNEHEDIVVMPMPDNEPNEEE